MATESTTPSIYVRRARPDEAGLLVDYQIHLALETEELALDPATVSAGVQAVFDDPAKGIYWVAESENQVVGGLLTQREWSDWRNGEVWWIHSVFVAPEARGRGVYRCLWETLQDRVLSSQDVVGLRLYVDRRNARAAQVYQALGMSREHYELFEWFPEPSA